MAGPDTEFLRSVKPPDIQRGAGPDQLPFGAAAQANQAIQAAPSPAAGQAQAPQPQAQAPEPNLPLSDDKDIHNYLLSPTERPNESVYAGLTAQNNPAPPPDIMDWLPFLAQAANLPEATPQVQALYQTLTYLANRG